MAQETTRRFTQRLNRRYAGFTLGVVLFVIALAAAERSGWPRYWIGGSFLIATVLVYAGIGLFSRTTDEAEYYVAGRRVPAMYNGMATAADWMSAASFLGTAGVLYLQGFGGLAYIIGWTGGYCLVAMLLAPYLRRFGQFTIPDFLGARFGGYLPRLIGVAAAVTVSFVYVVVQVYGVGLITSHLTGFSFEIGIFVGLGGVLVCSFLGGMRAVTWTQVAQYIVLILAYMVPVVWMNLSQTGSWTPLLTYGHQLRAVTQREGELLADPAERQVQAIWAQRADEARRKLGDVPAAMVEDAQRLAREREVLRADDAPLARIQQVERAIRRQPRSEAEARAHYERELAQAQRQSLPLAGVAPQTLPYAQPGGTRSDADTETSARRNFLALVFCLMMGTAAMPHVLTRYYTTPSVADARRSVGWSLAFIVLLYLCAPALAVMVKYQVFTELVGTPFSSLPEWLRRWSRLDTGLAWVQDVNGDGVLQFGELRLASDMLVLAAPEMGGLPLVVTYLVAAGGLAAALSTADGLLLTISNALSHDLYYRILNPRASAVRRVMFSKLMVLVAAVGAAWVASLRIAGILPFVTAAFSLAAAAFFPTLVAGVFWRRANRAGATAGMLVGLGVCAGYMVAGLPALRAWLGWSSVPLRWFDIEPVSAGVFGVPAGCAALVLASLLTPPPTREQLELVDRLRTPQREPTAGSGAMPPGRL